MLEQLLRDWSTSDAGNTALDAYVSQLAQATWATQAGGTAQHVRDDLTQPLDACSLCICAEAVPVGQHLWLVAEEGLQGGEALDGAADNECGVQTEVYATSTAQKLRALSSSLQAAGTFSDVRLIADARPPVLRAIHRASGVPVLLWCHGASCTLWRASLSTLQSLTPKFGSLLSLVELWARVHDVEQALASPLATTMLVIASLQTAQPALVPALCELFVQNTTQHTLTRSSSASTTCSSTLPPPLDSLHTSASGSASTSTTVFLGASSDGSPTDASGERVTGNQNFMNQTVVNNHQEAQPGDAASSIPAALHHDALRRQVLRSVSSRCSLATFTSSKSSCSSLSLSTVGVAAATLPPPSRRRLLDPPGPSEQEIQAALDHCKRWYASTTESGEWSARQAPTQLLSCVRWFFRLFSYVFTRWSQCRNTDWRLSVWRGGFYRGFQLHGWTQPYLVGIEDPFEASENVTKAFGTKYKPAGAAGYLAYVLSVSDSLLERACTTGSKQDMMLAVSYLWGPKAVQLLAAHLASSTAPEPPLPAAAPAVLPATATDNTDSPAGTDPPASSTLLEVVHALTNCVADCQQQAMADPEGCAWMDVPDQEQGQGPSTGLQPCADLQCHRRLVAACGGREQELPLRCSQWLDQHQPPEPYASNYDIKEVESAAMARAAAAMAAQNLPANACAPHASMTAPCSSTQSLCHTPQPHVRSSSAPPPLCRTQGDPEPLSPIVHDHSTHKDAHSSCTHSPPADQAKCAEGQPGHGACDGSTPQSPYTPVLSCPTDHVLVKCQDVSPPTTPIMADTPVSAAALMSHSTPRQPASRTNAAAFHLPLSLSGEPSPADSSSSSTVLPNTEYQPFTAVPPPPQHQLVPEPVSTVWPARHTAPELSEEAGYGSLLGFISSGGHSALEPEPLVRTRPTGALSPVSNRSLPTQPAPSLPADRSASHGPAWLGPSSPRPAAYLFSPPRQQPQAMPLNNPQTSLSLPESLMASPARPILVGRVLQPLPGTPVAVIRPARPVLTSLPPAQQPLVYNWSVSAAPASPLSHMYLPGAVRREVLQDLRSPQASVQATPRRRYASHSGEDLTARQRVLPSLPPTAADPNWQWLGQPSQHQAPQCWLPGLVGASSLQEPVSAWPPGFASGQESSVSSAAAPLVGSHASGTTALSLQQPLPDLTAWFAALASATGSSNAEQPGQGQSDVDMDWLLLSQLTQQQHGTNADTTLLAQQLQLSPSQPPDAGVLSVLREAETLLQCMAQQQQQQQQHLLFGDSLSPDIPASEAQRTVVAAPLLDKTTTDGVSIAAANPSLGTVAYSSPVQPTLSRTASAMRLLVGTPVACRMDPAALGCGESPAHWRHAWDEEPGGLAWLKSPQAATPLRPLSRVGSVTQGRGLSHLGWTIHSPVPLSRQGSVAQIATQAQEAHRGGRAAGSAVRGQLFQVADPPMSVPADKPLAGELTAEHIKDAPATEETGQWVQRVTPKVALSPHAQEWPGPAKDPTSIPGPSAMAALAAPASGLPHQAAWGAVATAAAGTQPAPDLHVRVPTLSEGSVSEDGSPALFSPEKTPGGYADAAHAALRALHDSDRHTATQVPQNDHGTQPQTSKSDGGSGARFRLTDRMTTQQSAAAQPISDHASDADAGSAVQRPIMYRRIVFPAALPRPAMSAAPFPAPPPHPPLPTRHSGPVAGDWSTPGPLPQSASDDLSRLHYPPYPSYAYLYRNPATGSTGSGSKPSTPVCRNLPEAVLEHDHPPAPNGHPARTPHAALPTTKGIPSAMPVPPSAIRGAKWTRREPEHHSHASMQHTGSADPHPQQHMYPGAYPMAQPRMVPQQPPPPPPPPPPRTSSKSNNPAPPASSTATCNTVTSSSSTRAPVFMPGLRTSSSGVGHRAPRVTTLSPIVSPADHRGNNYPSPKDPSVSQPHGSAYPSLRVSVHTNTSPSSPSTPHTAPTPTPTTQHTADVCALLGDAASTTVGSARQHYPRRLSPSLTVPGPPTAGVRPNPAWPSAARPQDTQGHKNSPVLPAARADPVWNQAASCALSAAQAAMARPLPATLVLSGSIRRRSATATAPTAVEPHSPTHTQPVVGGASLPAAGMPLSPPSDQDHSSPSTVQVTVSLNGTGPASTCPDSPPPKVTDAILHAVEQALSAIPGRAA